VGITFLDSVQCPFSRRMGKGLQVEWSLYRKVWEEKVLEQVFIVLLFFFKTGPCCVAQAGLELDSSSSTS
jgi:hypothetical protein